MNSAPHSLSDFKVKPVVVVDFGLAMDAARRATGAFSVQEIEDYLTGLRGMDYLVGGVHNRPQVGRMEETEQRYIAEVQLTLSKFGKNPFHWVKACYYDPVSGQGPFCRRSFLRIPDYGLLVLVEAEAWSVGVSTDWGNSVVVGLSPDMREMATRAGLRFQDASEVFGG